MILIIITNNYCYYYQINNLKIKSVFNSNNIEKERIIIRKAFNKAEEHLNYYSNVDIALDTFPYNGTTTTCESILMGVPVITMKGKRHAHNVGSSLLNCIGMTNSVAKNIRQYVDITMQMANMILKCVKDRDGILYINYL